MVTNFFADFPDTYGRTTDGDVITMTESRLNTGTQVGSWTIQDVQISRMAYSTNGFQGYAFPLFRHSDSSPPYQVTAHAETPADLSQGARFDTAILLNTGNTIDGSVRALFELRDADSNTVLRMSLAGVSDVGGRLSYYDGTDYVAVSDDLRGPTGGTIYPDNWDKISLNLNSDSFDILVGTNRFATPTVIASDIPYLIPATEISSIFITASPAVGNQSSRVRYNDISLVTIPEPATVGLVLAGLMIWGYRRRLVR